MLAHRLGLGDAFGGIVLPAIAINLPESAITISAAWRGDLGVAIGNILGGIATQTVVLVALDAFGTRGHWPPTYQAQSPHRLKNGQLAEQMTNVLQSFVAMKRSCVSAACILRRSGG